jgi:hypothetical protein
MLHYTDNPRFALASGCRDFVVEISRKTLFENGTLQIGLFESRPASDACGDVERQRLNAIVLPLSGVFSKHDAPGRHVIGTPSHAVFFAADTPYRIGFPGGIGDRAITLRFDEARCSRALLMESAYQGGSIGAKRGSVRGSNTTRKPRCAIFCAAASSGPTMSMRALLMSGAPPGFPNV